MYKTCIYYLCTREFLFYTDMTYREIIYMCLDALKITSDDAIFNEDHILFLVNKYRNLLLQQKYSDIRNVVLESNYQTLCLDLEIDNTKSVSICNEEILRSSNKIPKLMNIGNTEVTLDDYYIGEIALVSPNRMRYVGHNRWLQNAIYCSIYSDDHLYFKSANSQHLNLETVRLKGVFEDPIEAYKLSCDCSSKNMCDYLDLTLPLEDGLVPKLLELIVQFITTGIYKPEDTENNAKDDLSSMMQFIRSNMKSNLQKQIEG